jgi:hypothetical protein
MPNMALLTVRSTASQGHVALHQLGHLGQGCIFVLHQRHHARKHLGTGGQVNVQSAQGRGQGHGRLRGRQV